MQKYSSFIRSLLKGGFPGESFLVLNVDKTWSLPFVTWQVCGFVHIHWHRRGCQLSLAKVRISGHQGLHLESSGNLPGQDGKHKTRGKLSPDTCAWWRLHPLLKKRAAQERLATGQSPVQPWGTTASQPPGPACPLLHQVASGTDPRKLHQ